MEAAIELLGPIRLLVHGEERELGSVKERSVLAILCVQRPGQSVTGDQLVERLWDRPPDKARATLLSYLSRLRQRLHRLTDGQIQLVSTSAGYRLLADPEAIDLHRFRRLARQAAAIAASGDDEHALTLYQQAEGLYRGKPLEEAQSDWLRETAEGISEERRALQLDRLDCQLRLGLHPVVLGELRTLRSVHPLDERVSAQLMTALYRCGRQADALGVFHETRAALVETIGVEPGERLRSVQRSILRHDPDLAVTPRYRVSQSAPQPNTLPADTPAFVGREAEIRLLTAERLANAQSTGPDVVVGMPGVGKTALAVHVGHLLSERYPDAQLYLDLAAHDPARAALNTTQALDALLHMIGVPASQIPQADRQRAGMWQGELAARRMLVILDDPRDREQITPLLPGGRTGQNSHVIVAARRDMDGLVDARHVPLDVLSGSEAERLFRTIAGCPPDPLIIEAVRLCGFLPLAVRLTAARVAAGEVLAEVVDSLRAVVADPEISCDLDDVALQDGMSAAFSLSYCDLSKEHRTLFRRLALHPGATLTPAAATALGRLSDRELDASMRVLLEQHLVDQTADRTRYLFHDLLRSYARDRARHEDSPAERRQATRRLLAYYIRTAALAYTQLRPGRRDLSGERTALDVPAGFNARDWMVLEADNALAMASYASRHEWKEEAARLAYCVSAFLIDEGRWDQARSVLDFAMSITRTLQDLSATSRIALELGMVSFLVGDAEVALRHATTARAAAEASGDMEACADALDEIGIVHWSCGRFRESLAHAEEALARYQHVGAAQGEANALNHLGIVAWHLGRSSEAMARFDAALAIFERRGDGRRQAAVLNNIGDVKQSLGYHRDAMRLYRRSLELLGPDAGPRDRAIIHNNIGTVLRYKGRYREALDHYRQALATYRMTGDRRNTADTLNNIGMTYGLMERHSEALVHHQRAHDTADAVGSPYEKARALIGIADVHRDAGRYPTALEHYETALSLVRQIGDLYQEARVHEGSAVAHLHMGNEETARIRWRAALDIFRSLNVPEAKAVEIRLQALGVTA